jgi:hypothetical protein
MIQHCEIFDVSSHIGDSSSGEIESALAQPYAARPICGVGTMRRFFDRKALVVGLLCDHRIPQRDFLRRAPAALSLRSATHPRPLLRTARGALERDSRSLGPDHLHLRGLLLRTGSRSRVACAFLNVSLEEVVYGKE